MTDRAFEALALADVEALTVAGAGIRWRPVRRRLGITAFGVNAYVGGSGEHVVEEHTEATNGHEELYVVVDGRATFSLDGEEIDAPAGTLVFVRDPAARRSAVAAEDGTTVLAIGGRPGEPYEPSAWESWFAAYAYADAGEGERGVAELGAALAARPDHPALLYHLACLETRLGRREEAIEHLRRAVELDERMGEWAREDEDFDAIRDDPRFPSAIAGEPEAGRTGS